MNIPTRSFTDALRDMSSAITASAGKLIDVSVGSVLRAILEANAAVLMWAQWLVLLMLQTARAATSTGEDLDSWMADFSLTRLPALPSTGEITASRFSAHLSAIIPAGTIVKTGDGSVSFKVTADALNPAWQASLNSYSVPAGVTSINIPIVAVLPGSSGNVQVSTISLIASAVPGIDFINNLSPTAGGAEPEDDDAFRRRFKDFFAARSRATVDAIGFAVSQVRSDLNYVIIENIDSQGATRPGTMLIVVDDGSGLLPASLLDSLSSAVNAVRPIGTTIVIQPPGITQVQIRLSLKLPSDISVPAVQANAAPAIASYINRLPIGTMLSITRISQLIYDIEPRVISVFGVTLNDQTTDLTTAPLNALKFHSLLVV